MCLIIYKLKVKWSVGPVGVAGGGQALPPSSRPTATSGVTRRGGQGGGGCGHPCPPPLEFEYNIAIFIYNGPCRHCPPPCGILTSGITREDKGGGNCSNP